MRVLIAGSSGLIGTALRASYRSDGHQVVRLVRHEPRGADEVRFDPAAVDPRALEGADVVINLAGAALGDRRWNRRHREVIRQSRIGTARGLVAGLAATQAPPRILLSASGIRFYGIDRGEEVLTESSRPVREGLLPSVAQDWEAVTASARDAGIAVCHLRLGLVLAGDGGLLPPLARLSRAGVGVYFGAGREYWSCLSLADAVRAIRFLAESPDADGPYNISAPEPVRTKEFARALARLTGTRLVLRVPLPVPRVVLGPIATEVFGSLRVLPDRLTAAGFRFDHPGIDAALRAALDRRP